MNLALEIEVTAEGIETPDQLDQLADLGCDRGQGYYLARPLSAADFEALLARLERTGATSAA